MTGVWVDGKELPLNRFMTAVVGNIVQALARSLKAPPGNRIEFRIKGEHLQLQVNSSEIPLDRGQAQRIVGDVLRGIRSNLRGAETGDEIRFLWEEIS